MITEYIDSNPGSGFGITIYNPTSVPIDLSTYSVGTYNNGNTSGTSNALSGMLAPGAYAKVGNGSYCSPCAGGCNYSNSSSGVNGNDAVVLFKSPGMTFVDMVGLYGVDVFSKVDGISNALLHHHLYRLPTNCVRYTSVDGTSANSWSNTSAVSMTGWRVESVDASGESCLHADFVLDNSLTVRLPADTTICQGNALQLAASPRAGLQYHWNTGDTSASITVDSTAIYTVTGSRNGCLSRDSITVVFAPRPVFRFPTTDTSICDGDTLHLALADSVGWHYTWNMTDTGNSIAIIDSGIYVLGTLHNGCRYVDSISVAVRPLPVFSLGPDTGICQGDSILLGGLDQGNTFYAWNTGAEASGIYAGDSGTYWLTVVKNGCRFADSLHLAVNELPQVRLGADTVLCPDAVYTLAPWTSVTDIAYAWSGGQTSPTVTADKGQYSVTVTTAAGCVGRDTVSITREETVVFDLGSDRTLCMDSSTVLTTSADFASYQWSTGETSRTITVASTGSYTLTGLSNRGCASISLPLAVTEVPCNFSIPNIFTPNGDSKNDTWKTAQPFLSQAEVKVYNRWGAQVFTSSKPDFEWAGREATPGQYFYQVTGKTFKGDNFTQKGWIELVK